MTDKHTVSINQHSMYAATILIDGIPVQDVVRAYTVEAAVGEPTTVTVSLIPNGMTFEGEAAVRVTPLTRDLLMRMGWIPPDIREAMPCDTRGCDLPMHTGPHVATPAPGVAGAVLLDEPIRPGDVRIQLGEQGPELVPPHLAADEPIRKLQRLAREHRKTEVPLTCGATRQLSNGPDGPQGPEECIALFLHSGDHDWMPAGE